MDDVMGKKIRSAKPTVADLVAKLSSSGVGEKETRIEIFSDGSYNIFDDLYGNEILYTGDTLLELLDWILSD